MMAATDDRAALELVHQGWTHIQLQRPQAAWACWHRALRRAAEFPAAKQALATLESALELPAAARAVYRFRSPRDAAARARWSERLPGSGLEDLESAAGVFASLAGADPGDGAAAYNQALCLAWLGRNAESIAALERAVGILAETDFDHAVEAWTLAEVLRQGGGAEPLADDLSYAWIIDGAGDEARSSSIADLDARSLGRTRCKAQVVLGIHYTARADRLNPALTDVKWIVRRICECSKGPRYSIKTHCNCNTTARGHA